MVLTEALRQNIGTLRTQYPIAAAALLPALHMVQHHFGFVPTSVYPELAQLLDVAPTRIQEVVSFYTMFSEEPRGKHVLKICRNLPCRLRGADQLLNCAKQWLNIDIGETTPDGLISLETEECLASCGTAPMMWHNGYFVENLSKDKLKHLIQTLREDDVPSRR